MKTTEKKAIIGGAIVIIVVLSVIFGKAYYADQKRDIVTEQQNATKIESDSVKSQLPHISSQELGILLKDNADDIHIIDIRSKRSFEEKHLPNTINVPHETLKLVDIFLPAESIVVLIDEIDSSFSTNPILQEIIDAPQEKRVVYLDGGFAAWDTQIGQTISYGDPNSFVDHAKVSPVSKAQVQEKIARDRGLYTLLDVRSKKEYDKGHIDGAVNIPLNEIEEKSTALPIGTIIIVYGKDELQGFQAGVRLHDLGHLTVQMLKGGYESWLTPIDTENESATTISIPQQPKDPAINE